MKQIWPTYAYSPTTNVLTLTGLNIDRDQLLLVTAADRGRIMYNFADSSVTASAFTSGANTALTLVATTAGLTTTAALVIYYDDQLQSTSVSISNFPATQTIAGTVTVGQIQGYQHATAGTNGPYNADVILVGEDIEVSKAGALVIVPTARGGNVLGGRTAEGDTPICVYGDNGNAVTIAGTVTANPTGTQTIAGTVTANLGSAFINTSGGYQPVQFSTGLPVANEKDGITFDAIPFLVAGSVTIGSALPAGTNRIGVVTIGGGTVTLGASTAQIGSVTANTFALQGTAVTTSNFTSTTPSTILASANSGREVLTIFNEGAGNLHICAGATCTTIAYQVRLSAGDYYEVPNHQTTITHSAVFATAGTARVTEVS